MAAGLVGLYGLHRDNPRIPRFGADQIVRAINGPTFCGGRCELNLLRHWQLAVGSSGFHQLKPSGYDFVEERISVPRTLRLKDYKAVEIFDSHVCIRQALGDRFCLEELLGYDYNVHGLARKDRIA